MVESVVQTQPAIPYKRQGGRSNYGLGETPPRHNQLAPTLTDDSAIPADRVNAAAGINTPRGFYRNFFCHPFTHHSTGWASGASVFACRPRGRACFTVLPPPAA